MRVWHAGISAFIAPMVLFYAFSGALQIFDLHDAHGSYVPSPVIAAMGQIHKNQVLAVPHKHASRPKPDEPEAQPPPVAPATMALRILFFGEAFALVFTTLLGVTIGVTHPKYARRTWILLALGLLIPAGLLII